MTEQVSEVFGKEVVDDLKVGVRFRCLLFLPVPGDMIQFEEHIFSDELKPPTRLTSCVYRIVNFIN